MRSPGLILQSDDRSRWVLGRAVSWVEGEHT